MITLLADDLSGAQEALAATVVLTEEPADALGLLLDVDALTARGPEVLAVDLDARGLAPEAAASSLRHVLDRLARVGRTDGPLLVKIDSLLRGPVAALVGALAESSPVVLCPAVPALGRTVEQGRLLVQGTPLNCTDLWAVENGAPPAAVEQVVPEAAPVLIDLEAVRGPELSARFASAFGRSRVVVADAVTDADCTAVVRAADQLGAVLVGAAGLARAAGALHRAAAPSAGVQQRADDPSSGTPAGPADGAPPAASRRSEPVAVVVGSAAETARDQVELLAEHGLPVLRWSPGSPLVPPERDVVLVLDAPFDPGRSDQLNVDFADAVVAAVPDHHLVLTGGQTARAVLDRLGVDRLHPLSEPHHGAVVAKTGNGRLVATRPGSFGDRDSLLTLHRALRSAQLSDQTTSTRGPAA